MLQCCDRGVTTVHTAADRVKLQSPKMLVHLFPASARIYTRGPSSGLLSVPTLSHLRKGLAP